MVHRIQYLNTDLNLTSTGDLTAIAAGFERGGVYALDASQCDDGMWRAGFETNISYDDPDSNIAAMLAAVEAFSSVLLANWANCTQREFNIGYDCGDEPWAFNQGLSSALLGRIAAVGASLRITIYPDRE